MPQLAIFEFSINEPSYFDFSDDSQKIRVSGGLMGESARSITQKKDKNDV
jgi:hypothetical protein